MMSEGLERMRFAALTSHLPDRESVAAPSVSWGAEAESAMAVSVCGLGCTDVNSERTGDSYHARGQS